MTDNTTEATPITAIFKMVYLAALEVFMARNDVRYYLNGICIKPCSEGGALLTATDGHRLMMIRDPEGFASREFIIPNMPQVLKICRTKQPRKLNDRLLAPSTIVVNDNRLNIVTGSFHATDCEQPNVENCADHLHSAWPFKEIDGNFPDVARVLPKDLAEKSDPAISVNCKYLADFYKAAQHLCPKNHFATTIIQRDKHSPLVLRLMAPDTEALAVIMPMRNGCEENPNIPSWAYNSPSQEATKKTAAAA